MSTTEPTARPDTTQQPDFTFTYEVPQSPNEVFDAVTNVRGWWSQRIDGATDRLGEFVYTVPQIHTTRAEIIELIPGERVVWRILDNRFGASPDQVDEWAGTTVRFDIAPTTAGTRLTFTHVGLTSALDCYDGCAEGWTVNAHDSLHRLITTGKGNPITPEVEADLLAAG
ncbi:SRPBCC family protein [Brevibacterium spongiae]|uniref:SRPBCC domain-containing protein n=1 Tax=Brevibacterium spongiae TaxID=2909672 RepID=A0ABY5SLM7_9MICO|nr:SRPBCC domain-containing protein [Brevibacterium spongiae]UVI35185.1 SRPBCC domain-containing protein [Brevibacterium spongiae]